METGGARAVEPAAEGRGVPAGYSVLDRQRVCVSVR